MTIAEVLRVIDSYNRVKQAQVKEKAFFDYTLANLIIKGVGITLGSKDTFPPIEEVYSSLFKNEDEVQEKVQKQKDNLSTLRFLQFAQSYNKRFQKEVLNKE